MTISEIIQRASLGGLNDRFLLRINPDSTTIQAKSNANSFQSIVLGPSFLSEESKEDGIEVEVDIINAGDLEKLVALVPDSLVTPVYEFGSQVRDLIFDTEEKRVRFTIGGSLELDEKSFSSSSGTPLMLPMCVNGSTIEALKKAASALKTSDITIYVNEDNVLIGRVGHSDSNYFEMELSDDEVAWSDLSKQNGMTSYISTFNAKPLFAANKFNKKGEYEFHIYRNQAHVVISQDDDDEIVFQADYLLTKIR